MNLKKAKIVTSQSKINPEPEPSTDQNCACETPESEPLNDCACEA